MRKIKTSLFNLLNLIYPKSPYCSCCNDCISKEYSHGLCKSCIDQIDWCFDNRYYFVMDDFSFDDVLCCCIYGYRPRQLIQNLKLKGETYIARDIGSLLAERAMLDMKTNGSIYDLLIPVPSSKEKEEHRGFNQANLLCKYASNALGIPYQAGILLKTKETPSQRLSGAVMRRKNQEGAFSISKGKEKSILGKSILLVDDVITTASTADYCSRELKKAGAASVTVLCFASAAQISKQ